MKTVINENRKCNSHLDCCRLFADSVTAETKRRDDFKIFMMGIYLNKKLVVLRLPADVPNLLVKAKDIYEKMKANATLFDAPNPTMPIFLQNIEAGFKAEAAMEDPDSDKTNTRDKAVATVILDCGTERDYVQSKVNLDLPNADSIVIDAGMGLKSFTSRQKQVWAVFYTGLSGEVELQSQVKAQRCAYEWQATYTPESEASWWTIHLNVTLQASTKVNGLTPGRIVHLRYRHILKDGPDDWSEVLSIMVV